jgi:hypothetical protein
MDMARDLDFAAEAITTRPWIRHRG